MRLCPRCERTYEHPLRYCPEDGTPLVESESMVGAMPLQQRASASTPVNGRTGMWVAVGVFGALFLVLLMGLAFMLGRGSDLLSTLPSAAEEPSAPLVSSSGSEGDRAAAYSLDEGRDIEPSTGEGMTRYVDAPGDGYLALRSEPSVDSGERLRRIPHGASIEITDCGRSDTIGGRRGAWCATRYDGTGGWVFDGYLAVRASDVATRSTRPGLVGRVTIARSTTVWGPEGYLNLRTSPSLRADVRGQMPNGATVYVAECERRVWGGDPPRRWCRIQYRGVEGWASDRFLDGISP